MRLHVWYAASPYMVCWIDGSSTQSWKGIQWCMHEKCFNERAFGLDLLVAILFSCLHAGFLLSFYGQVS